MMGQSVRSALLASAAMVSVSLCAAPSWADEPSPANTWEGFYGGISGGIGSFNGRAMDWEFDIFESPDGDIDLRGFAGIFGAQAGYNYQLGGLVIGLEGDVSWTGFSEGRSFDDDTYYVKANMDWLATVRGRMGLANEQAMAYVTGGLALAGVEHCANEGDPCSIDGDDAIAWSGTQPGLVAGAGVEARLSDRWSFKSEYLYLVTANKNVIYDTGGGDVDFGFDAHIFRVGLNYHLGGLPTGGGSDMYAGGPWQGLYAGVNGGIGSFNGRAIDWHWGTFRGPDADIDQRGFAGIFGAQAGYNHQHGGFVFGFEGDVSWTGFSEGRVYLDDTIPDSYVKSNMDWLATVRGRMGVANDQAMAYVTGGLALAGVEHCANSDHDAPCSIDNDENIAWSGTQPGLVAGAGVEARLSNRWSFKSEYLYLVTADKNIVYNSVLDHDIDFGFDAHIFRVGLNYHLGGLPTGGSDIPSGGPWQGLYAGVSGGIGSFNGRTMDSSVDLVENPDGDFDLRSFAGIFGAQAGYNYQMGGLVFGFEGDASWTGFSEDDTLDGGDHYVKANMDWLATVRGRMGVANDKAMAYVTGGLALAGVEHCANDNDPCSIDGDDDIAWSGTQPGLVAGAGVEARLSDRWSFKSEYLYLVTADKNLVYDTTNGQDVDFGFDAHIFRVGLNYKFNVPPLM
ncbi:outer membrane beta-barrel protein [Nitratireductor sp. XY-223]|uniref:outer membrane protein n=1 Tax=Nitratireductor sp. XY-223 TaxID=2561926 RepID=UPI0010AA1B61|nr:outer membrane beta-barrel protein [Nitratireductor sp. XY-223]